MDIVDGLVWPVITAGVIGLGALAIGKPKRYLRLLPWLYGGSCVVYLGMLGWSMAYENGARAAFRSMDPVDKAVGMDMGLKFNFDAFPFSNMSLIIGFACWMAYLTFIGFLPKIVGTDEEPVAEKPLLVRPEPVAPMFADTEQLADFHAGRPMRDSKKSGRGSRSGI